MPQPTATWNPARSVWETNEHLVCGHSAVYSGTWPSSGTWVDGMAYAHPTSEPLTPDSGSSSSPGLLPTPTASEATGAGYTDRENGGGRNLRTEVSLLPTPMGRDGKGANQRGDTTCLHGALLPTPRATDGTKGGPNQRGSSGDLMLPSAVALLATPRVAASRTSRGAATRPSSMSSPSLEQCIEIAQGELPREFTTWDELPPSWHGDHTAPPSTGGKASSDG